GSITEAPPRLRCREPRIFPTAPRPCRPHGPRRVETNVDKGRQWVGIATMDHRSLILLASVIAFAVAGTSALAEDGVTKDRIVFGQVAALEGPVQALGQGMRQGLLAAFAEVNRAGGVAGRQLELKSADDSYEPQKTIEAMKKMLAEEKVFAIVGAVGT